MDEEIKMKLEEMAHDSSDVGELVYTARGLPVWRVDEDKKLAFMAGAQAAWTLAVELERARCARLIANAGSSEDDRHRAIGEILVPSEEVKT